MFLLFMLKLKSVFLLFVNIFRLAFCCFRRRRRLSKDEPLSNIVVNEQSQVDLEQWNDWEFKNRKPASVEEHIEYYRQQQAKLRQQQPEEQTGMEQMEEDLFNHMMPKITKQAKIVIGAQDEDAINERNASLNLQAIDSYITNELENWDENLGWESAALGTDELLREKKREERDRRLLEQQKKRAERSNRPILGAKLVT